MTDDVILDTALNPGNVSAANAAGWMARTKYHGRNGDSGYRGWDSGEMFPGAKLYWLRECLSGFQCIELP